MGRGEKSTAIALEKFAGKSPVFGVFAFLGSGLAFCCAQKTSPNPISIWRPIAPQLFDGFIAEAFGAILIDGAATHGFGV